MTTTAPSSALKGVFDNKNAQYLRRPPRVLPDRADSFAFLGQFTDLPEDVVFTVEYSVHGAMHAVYGLFGVGKEIPPIYHGLLDPKVGLKALESAFR